MDRISPWLREKIADAAPGVNPTTQQVRDLFHAAGALRTGHGMMFGMTYGGQPLTDRDGLYAATVEMIEQWLPRLAASELEAIRGTAESLGIAIAPHLGKLEAKILAEAEARRAAFAAGEPSDPELDRSIASWPDDPAPYSVYGDWLEAKGSPRGALIQLALRAEREPAHQAEVDRHVARHAAALIGDLEPDGVELTWRRGFIRGARMSSPDGLGSALETLLVHPSGRFLAELSLGMDGESGGEGIDHLIAMIERTPPATLRSLFLGDFIYPDECEMSWYDVGGAPPPWHALPQLEKIIVQGGQFTLGTIVAPALRHAELRTGGLSEVSAQAIAHATWPRLRRLDVWWGDGAYGGDATVADIRAVLARRDLPELRHLGMMNATNTDTICELLLGSPVLPQLELVDLSRGTLGDEGAGVILSNPAAFRHLKRLVISDSFISDPVLDQLRTLGPELIAEDMHEPCGVDDRYIAVSE